MDLSQVMTAVRQRSAETDKLLGSVLNDPNFRGQHKIEIIREAMRRASDTEIRMVDLSLAWERLVQHASF